GGAVRTGNVSRDRVLDAAVQVVAETTPLRAIREASHRASEPHHQELADVLGVVGVEPAAAAVAQDEVPVPRVELAPRLVVPGVPHPGEEGRVRALSGHAGTVADGSPRSRAGEASGASGVLELRLRARAVLQEVF